MTYRSLIMSRLMMAVLLAFGPATEAEQVNTAPTSTGEVMAWLQHLATEVRRLRVELLESRLEVLQSRLPELERDVVSLQGEQRRLERDRQTRLREVASLEDQLARSELGPEERRELEARRAELVGVETEKLRADAGVVAQREAAAHDRLVQQQRLIRSLQSAGGESVLPNNSPGRD
jgi:predicted nuclease with TOPRIM domain